MRRRVFILMCIMLGLYTCLVGFLVYHQLIQGPTLANQAADMRSRRVPLKEYSRGNILDRNLLPLSGSENTLAVYALPHIYNSQELEASLSRVAHQLAPIIKQEPQTIYQEMKEAEQQNMGWVRLEEGLSPEQQNSIEALNLPSLLIAPINKRYRSDGFCVHLLGYLGGGEKPVGAAGVERVYNEILQHDSPGQQLVSVHDARGLVISGLMYKIRQEQEEQKSSVVLTLDRRVQDIVEAAMDRSILKGAVVVMDVDSKDVLAMASRPTFNPYQVAQTSISDSPLLNRALNRYYPGSLFKIVVTAAALEEGLVRPDEEFNCTGKYTMKDGFSIACLRENGHGQLNFSQAFALSCNPTFIEVGSRVGTSRLLAYARKMHMDQASLVGYPVAAGGGIQINPGSRALANACLGQQGVMMTPLQVCSLVATIADQGRWSAPRLLRYTVNAAGQRQDSLNSSKEQVISLQTAAILQGMMEKVVKEGTGTTAAFPEARAAGKTGTSQTGAFKGEDEEVLDAWFGGYFPIENPRWAIVVLVEEGQSGARDAAPVFQEIARKMVNTMGSRQD